MSYKQSFAQKQSVMKSPMETSFPSLASKAIHNSKTSPIISSYTIILRTLYVIFINKNNIERKLNYHKYKEKPIFIDYIKSKLELETIRIIFFELLHCSKKLTIMKIKTEIKETLMKDPFLDRTKSLDYYVERIMKYHKYFPYKLYNIIADNSIFK